MGITKHSIELECYVKRRYSFSCIVHATVSCCSFVDLCLQGPGLMLPLHVFFFDLVSCLLAPTEQIFHNLRQECSRIQRRRQLEGAFNQAEACSSSDSTSPISSLNAPSSPPGKIHPSKWLCDAMNSSSSILNSSAMPEGGKMHTVYI